MQFLIILNLKLLQLNQPPNVLLWIINFLSSRTQVVSSFGQTSGWLSISQSIIQGSGIGPYLYMIYASDLRTLSSHNVIVKYADDTTLLVGQHSSGGVSCTDFDIDDLIDSVDHNLFCHITDPNHCLRHLLPPIQQYTTAHRSYSL